MPKRIRRADELPVPFTPAEVEHVDNFPRTDQEYEEANATDVAATGADDLANATCSLYHHHVSLSASALEARLAWMAVATRIHYRIISARYDYLVASKNEHGLAELHLATDAVPRNKGRGPGWQRFFNAVSADEAKVFTKSAAEIPWRVRPRYHRAKAYPVAEPDRAFAEAEMERCTRLGYWTELFGEDKELPVVIVNGFVTWSAGKQGFVIDARHQNAHIDDRAFHYENLFDLAPQLRAGDQLMSWDVKDAYHHVPLRVEDRVYFGFQCSGRVFLCNTMPFGLKVAPFLWTKICRPVVEALRREGFRIVAYVDDFGGAPPTAGRDGATEPEVSAAAARVRELFGSLGLTLHQTKGEWGGTTCLPHLGLLVDTGLRLFHLRPDRTVV
eukprot:contig_2090_g367